MFRRDENNEIQYLVLQYRNPHWEFPRGHKEKGETDEETARREIFEETGISKMEMLSGFSENTYFFYIARGSEREKRKTNESGIYIFKKAKFFLAETKETEVKLSHEQLDYAWLSYEQALEKVTYKNAKNVLKKAQEFLERR